MATQTKSYLKSKFETGDKPAQDDYFDLIDSFVHKNDVQTNTNNITHTGEVTGDTALTITNKAVTLSKMNDVESGTIFYRKTTGTGSPEVQTLDTLKTDLNIKSVSSFALVYNFRSDIVNPPNSGEIKLNNDIKIATILKLSEFDKLGIKNDEFIDSLKFGDLIMLSNSDNSIYHTYIINEDLFVSVNDIDNIPVTYSAGTTEIFNDNDIISFSLMRMPVVSTIGFAFNYKFDSTLYDLYLTIGTPPALGYIKFNNNDITLADTMSVSETDTDLVDINNIIDSLRAGDIIKLTNYNGTEYKLFVVRDKAYFCVNGVDNIPIQYYTGTSGSIQNSDKIAFSILRMPTAEIQSTTYLELKQMITDNKLVIGRQYLLIDYYTKYIQPNTNKIKCGKYDFDTITPEQMLEIQEKILLTADSSNTFESIAKSTTYTGHELTYSFNDVTTRGGIGTEDRPGFILRRNDLIRKVSIDCDYLQMVNVRYKLDYARSVNVGIPTSIEQWKFYSVDVYPNTVYVCIKPMNILDFVTFDNTEYFRPIYGNGCNLTGYIFWTDYVISAAGYTFSFYPDLSDYREFPFANTYSVVYVNSSENVVIYNEFTTSNITRNITNVTILNNCTDNGTILNYSNTITGNQNWSIIQEKIEQVFCAGSMSDLFFKGIGSCFIYGQGYFEYTTWLARYFENSIIGDNFKQNFGKGSFNGNIIYDNFQDNEVASNITNNTFGNNFKNALIPSNTTLINFGNDISNYGNTNKDIDGMYYIDKDGVKNYFNDIDGGTF